MIPLFTVNMPPRDHLMPKLAETLYSGYITQGARVEEFEDKLAAYFGTTNVLTVNSGTSAIQLALRLSDVSGGEVVTTPMTCSATVLPILAENATPVWADVDPTSGNLDPESVLDKITEDTRAILVVHWGGQPGRMDQIMNIAQHYDIPVIVDAAHALGALWDKQSIALQADFTCYSLQAIKHITTGDGGILVTKDDYDYERGKRLRWFGLDRDQNSGDARVDNDILEPGYKFHMNDIAATIGIAQLHYLKHIVLAHRMNARLYDLHLPVQRQSIPEQAHGAWWLYTLLFDDAAERVGFMDHMKRAGIQTSRVHGRLDHLTAFKKYSKGHLPGVTEFFDCECCIPVHSNLTDDQRDHIIKAVKEF